MASYDYEWSFKLELRHLCVFKVLKYQEYPTLVGLSIELCELGLISPRSTNIKNFGLRIDLHFSFQCANPAHTSITSFGLSKGRAELYQKTSNFLQLCYSSGYKLVFIGNLVRQLPSRGETSKHLLALHDELKIHNRFLAP